MGGDKGPAPQLAGVVRAHRERAGLTQQELARRAGLSLAALRDLEQGRRRPRSRSLTALAAALGLDSGQAAELTSGTAAERRHAILVPAPVRRPAPSLTPEHPPASGPWNRGQGLRLSVLGSMEASFDGKPLSLGPPSRRAMLGLLATNPGVVVRRHALIDALWGQLAPSTAPSLVQAHASRLRKLLAPGGNGHEVIASVGGGYRLQLREEQLDLLVFRALAASAEAARGAGDGLTACELYEQALALWRGDPLADLDGLHDQPSVASQRRQLADALLRYSETACGLGLHDRVLPRLHALAASEPLNEHAHACLMIALAGTGQQAAAIRVFEDIRDRLDRELAIYPSAELADAHIRVLHQNIPVRRNSLGQPSSHPGVPRQLPASPKHFADRHLERRMLSDLLPSVPPEPGKVAVAALTGMAGVGKTALAVNWAHEAATRFPDGQLFADLRGFGNQGSQAEPAEILREFLIALGVSPTRLLGKTAELAALYRSTLVSRHVLIVLDNARDAEQVRPLLPGSSDCLVLITSRNRLIGLAAADGAHLIALSEMTDGESYGLMTRMLGVERVTAESGAVEKLITLCARLPLALCNVAARATVTPGRSLATLAEEMEDKRGRLDALETGEPTSSVRGAFTASHDRLTGPASRMFLMLGMHPGPEITVQAAAALADLDRSRAQSALTELCDNHLLTERGTGQYTCHELVRAYATETVSRQISEAERRAAVQRMLGLSGEDRPTRAHDHREYGN